MYYKEWLHEWMEYYVKPSSKDKTYMVYQIMVERHVIPLLGNHHLEDLNPVIVQKTIGELLSSGNIRTGEGLSANTVNTIIAVIQGSLETAYRVGMVSKYEMDKIKRPKSRERQILCFSPAEQRKIEEAALADRRSKMKGIIICLYTGLRIGELLALEWGDIDFQNAEMHINKTCFDAKDANGDFVRLTNAPKTPTSVRIIPIAKPIINLLKEMRRNSHSKYVISGGDKDLSVRSYQRSFELFLKKLQIPHRGFHSLRHTFATRALECGMDVKTLSEILGHKNPTITLNRYVHSMMEHKRDMMNRLAKLL